MRIYLDSCIVIYAVEGEPEVVRTVRRHISDAGPDARICVSELTRLECLVRPLREQDSDALERYDRFFSLDRIEIVDISADVFRLATELRATLGWKTPDALHVAAARTSGCAQFWTNDHKLAVANSGIAVRVPV